MKRVVLDKLSTRVCQGNAGWGKKCMQDTLELDSEGSQPENHQQHFMVRFVLGESCQEERIVVNLVWDILSEECHRIYQVL